MCAVKKATGVRKGNISKYSDATLTGSTAITGQLLWASRWMAGTSDNLYATTDSEPWEGSTWSAVVTDDLFSDGTTIKNITYGEDDSGGKLWVIGTNSTDAEIGYCEDNPDALERNFDAAGGSPKWAAVSTFTGNATAASGGPGITFANGVWVGGGHDSGTNPDITSIKRSTDGAASWTQITDAPQQEQAARCVCYKSGDTWFATNDSDIWKSTDNGVSWDLENIDPGGITGVIYCMAYDGAGVWVAAGNDGAGDLAISDDDWSSDTTVDSDFGSSQNKIWGVVFVERLEKWVAVGQSGKISLSSDRTATSWSAQTTPVTAVLNAVCTDGRTIVVAGDGGRILTSTDGTTWELKTIGGAGNLECIACDIIGEGMR